MCRRHDIALLRIFGSSVRGDEDAGSDVDLRVRFATRKSLVDLARAERDLSRRVGRPVDLVTEDALSPYLRGRVLNSARVPSTR